PPCHGRRLRPPRPPTMLVAPGLLLGGLLRGRIGLTSAAAPRSARRGCRRLRAHRCHARSSSGVLSTPRGSIGAAPGNQHDTRRHSNHHRPNPVRPALDHPRQQHGPHRLPSLPAETPPAPVSPHPRGVSQRHTSRAIAGTAGYLLPLSRVSCPASRVRL